MSNRLPLNISIYNPVCAIFNIIIAKIYYI